MTRSVWKFPVPQGGRPHPVDVLMPARSEIIRAGQQNDTPMIWAIVDPAETQAETRRILVLPTGADSSERLHYIGSTELYDGVIVLHVFEVLSGTEGGLAGQPAAAFDQDWTVGPGEFLREWREENGLGIEAAATTCARLPTEMYERIEAGRETITPGIAAALAHGTSISARLWLNLERRYRDDLKAGKVDTTSA